MPDYKKLYIDLFISVNDEIGFHIQRLQDIQQASNDGYAKVRLAVTASAEKERPPADTIDERPPIHYTDTTI